MKLSHATRLLIVIALLLGSNPVYSRVGRTSRAGTAPFTLGSMAHAIFIAVSPYVPGEAQGGASRSNARPLGKESSDIASPPPLENGESRTAPEPGILAIFGCGMLGIVTLFRKPFLGIPRL